MKSIAIIGSGVAGMASAYFLRKDFNVQVFERNETIGGHTNTVMVREGDTEIPIDTGFMVYNEVTYPNLTRLFRELEVATKPTAMSFSVQYLPTNLEFAGTGFNGLFAQRRRLLSLPHYRLLFEINRFNNTCTEILEDPHFESMSLAEYLRIKGFSDAFAAQYLIPMSSAVWSTPPDKMLAFPAATLVRFFFNHGFLGLHCQHPWRTVSNGSKMYRDCIVQMLPGAFHTKRAARSIERSNGRVVVTDEHGTQTTFDCAIIATHADEALALLKGATVPEQGLLSAFRYQENIATLHTDDAVMPANERAWCAWNYRVEKNGDIPPSTIYWMNRLQGVSDRQNYFVSINDPGIIRAEKVIKTIHYTHPLFSTPAIQAQRELPDLNRTGPVYFCGSYFKYGFHEDALTSAVELSRQLLGRSVWS